MSNPMQIETSYGIDSDFYRLFLDKRMIYSCGLFIDTDDLDQAQTNKLNFIADAAHVEPGMQVLDIGCGWGGNIDFLANERGASLAMGITLSAQQFQEVEKHVGGKVQAELVNYLHYEPSTRFDAITSIGMFEHIASPAQARSGQNIELYREYFHRAWEWTRPGAWFGLQTVTQLRIARDPQFLRDIGSVTYGIFPGAINPRLEAIMAAVNPYWEVVEVHMRREHYARTCAAWHERLVARRDDVITRWGEARYMEYEHYFRRISEAFHAGYGSLAQISLRRMDPVRPRQAANEA
jgi:cyclopropane-fatty-acyl-phospholipid synthase